MKYNCVPGDCVYASVHAFGLNFYNVAGDGDGYISTYTPNEWEGWNALGELASAKMLKDNVGYGTGTGNLPIPNAFMFFTSFHPPSLPTAGWVTPKDGNYLYIGTYPGNGQDFVESYPILLPSQAFAIDSKIDDGLPMSGSVRATAATNVCPGLTPWNWQLGPCYNTPNNYTLVATPKAMPNSCVDDRVTPNIYDVKNESKTSGNYTPMYSLCSISVPAD